MLVIFFTSPCFHVLFVEQSCYFYFCCPVGFTLINLVLYTLTFFRNSFKTLVLSKEVVSVAGALPVAGGRGRGDGEVGCPAAQPSAGRSSGGSSSRGAFSSRHQCREPVIQHLFRNGR